MLVWSFKWVATWSIQSSRMPVLQNTQVIGIQTSVLLSYISICIQMTTYAASYIPIQIHINQKIKSGRKWSCIKWWVICMQMTTYTASYVPIQIHMNQKIKSGRKWSCIKWWVIFWVGLFAHHRAQHPWIRRYCYGICQDTPLCAATIRKWKPRHIMQG